TTPLPGNEALDFLAARLVQLLDERARAGLHRGYAERTDQGPFLQGRLDVAAQLREPSARKDVLHCSYEDFTTDIPCNQVPRATADLALQSPLLGDSVRAALRRSLRPYELVSPIALGPESFAARLPEYRPLLDLCRLLAEGLMPGADAGATS